MFNNDLIAKIGVDTAENEPDVEVYNTVLLVLRIFSPANSSSARTVNGKASPAIARRSQGAVRGSKPRYMAAVWGPYVSVNLG